MTASCRGPASGPDKTQTIKSFHSADYLIVSHVSRCEEEAPFPRGQHGLSFSLALAVAPFLLPGPLLRLQTI